MDLKELDRKLTELPPMQKILLLALVGILLCLYGYYYIYIPKQKKQAGLSNELNKLQATLRENLEITKGIKSIEEELEKMRLKLLEVKAQLPTDKEIPTLLTKISDLGSMVGLEFVLFQPKAEVPQEFYNEVPIDIVIKGSYHTVAQFFDAIAHLPRIVNINNIIMKNPIPIGDTIVLNTSCLATTFRYVPKESEGGETKK